MVVDATFSHDISPSKAYFQDTVNLTKERNPFYLMPDLKFLLLDGHIRPFLCLPHYLCCGCLTTFFTSHHCVPRHNLCGASAGRAPLNLTWRVVPWLSQLGGGHKCTIMSAFTEVLIILHRNSEGEMLQLFENFSLWKELCKNMLDKVLVSSFYFFSLSIRILVATPIIWKKTTAASCTLTTGINGWICVMMARWV